jgi:hypothetical protein
MEVRIQMKIGIFSTAFNSHPTYTRDLLGQLCTPPGGWGLQQSTGNGLNFEKEHLLVGKK